MSLDCKAALVLPGCSNPLGLEDGGVYDFQLSSYTHKDGWGPFLGRYNNGRGWCSATNDVNHEFLQVDLLNVQHIARIAMQGVRGLYPFSGSYYVMTFVIEYSYDGTTWLTYKSSSGSVQTFVGNNDTFSERNNYFRDTFVTRYIRIYPKTFYGNICLRVELYGCNDQSDDCSTYITTASGSIKSPSFPGNYPANKHCTWLIEVSKGKNISLMFTQFDVYQGSNPGTCRNDYVEIRDGLTDSSPLIGGKYCNQNRTMLITTNSNVARIYFQSGVSNLGHKGFQIYFLSVTKGSDDVLGGTACDGEVLALDCSGYQNTINVLHARYQIGSFPFSCGQHHNNYSRSTSCPAFDALSQIKSKCQVYKKCLIIGRESSFPDQNCARVRCQLEVFYQCSSTNVKTPAPTLPSLLSHSLNTDHVRESTTDAKATDTSAVTQPNTTPITEVTSNRTVERKEDQIAEWVTTGRVVTVVALIIARFLRPLFLDLIKKLAMVFKSIWNRDEKFHTRGP